MASGQSSLQWLVGNCDVDKIISSLPDSVGSPPIREFGVTGVVTGLHPIEHAAGEWKTGGFDNCSAIAFVSLTSSTGDPSANWHPPFHEPHAHRLSYGYPQHPEQAILGGFELLAPCLLYSGMPAPRPIPLWQVCIVWACGILLEPSSCFQLLLV